MNWIIGSQSTRLVQCYVEQRVLHILYRGPPTGSAVGVMNQVQPCKLSTSAFRPHNPFHTTDRRERVATTYRFIAVLLKTALYLRLSGFQHRHSAEDIPYPHKQYGDLDRKQGKSVRHQQLDGIKVGLCYELVMKTRVLNLRRTTFRLYVFKPDTHSASVRAEQPMQKHA